MLHHASSQLAVTDRGDSRDKGVTVGEVAVWRTRGNAGAARHGAQGQPCGSIAFFE